MTRDTLARDLGIAEIATRSGLTQDTLRWYEREGLLPSVARRADRRRRYSERDAALVVMLARLRDTGMPTEEMREFSRMVAGGAQTHGRRLALLERHRERVIERMSRLADGLDALDEKTAHYRRLIDAGLDCDERPVPDDIRAAQRERGECTA